MVFKDSLKTIVLSLITLSLVGVAYAAWTEPTLTPPSGNTSTPINTSNTGQAKSGGLQLNTSGADVGLVVNGKQKVNTWLSYFDPATSNEYGVYQWESAGAGTTPVNYFQNNVGIGTTTPETKLDVNGKMRLRQDFTVYNTNGPYTYCSTGRCPSGQGGNPNCTCQSGNEFWPNSTCSYNSYSSGGNNYFDCVFTASIEAQTKTRIVECGVDINGSFSCITIQ